MAKGTMSISMDGLRHTLVREYNQVVRRLKEHIIDNLTDDECKEMHQVLDEDFYNLRQTIGILLCVFDPDEKDKNFTNLSAEIDNLEDFEE